MRRINRRINRLRYLASARFSPKCRCADSEPHAKYGWAKPTWCFGVDFDPNKESVVMTFWETYDYFSRHDHGYVKTIHTQATKTALIRAMQEMSK